MYLPHSVFHIGQPRSSGPLEDLEPLGSSVPLGVCDLEPTVVWFAQLYSMLHMLLSIWYRYISHYYMQCITVVIHSHFDISCKILQTKHCIYHWMWVDAHAQNTYAHRFVYLCPNLAHPRSANELTVVSFDAVKQKSLIVKVNSTEETLCLVIWERHHVSSKVSSLKMRGKTPPRQQTYTVYLLQKHPNDWAGQHLCV